MYIQVNKSIFMDQFRKMDRHEGWTYEGLSALFDYITDCEFCEPEQELDVVALCCQFTEYTSLEDFNEQTGEDCTSIDEIEFVTTVIRINDTSFIASEF
jgi:hypothetical protein